MCLKWSHANHLFMQYYPEKIYTWFEKLMANSGLSDETVVPTSKHPLRLLYVADELS